MTFFYIRLLMGVTWIVAAYIWGDWRNWRKYYPTMLFFGFGDLIYSIVFPLSNKPLWKFETYFLVPSINELFVIFTIFFSTTLIFLSKFPKKLYHRIIYIVLWIAIYMAIEIFTASIGMIKNYNGWTIWWSLLHNSVQFPMLILHHKNPILAWIIAFVFLIIIMKTFNVPIILNT